MNIKDFKVGDEVITVIDERDYVNGGRKDIIRKEKVMSVGRKYVQVTRFGDERFIAKFSAKDYFPYGLVKVVNIGSHAYLFKSIEDYNNYIEYQELIRYMTREASYKFDKLSLEQLRTIKKIIENQED